MCVSIEHVFLAYGANGREVLTEDSAFLGKFFFGYEYCVSKTSALRLFGEPRDVRLQS